LLWGGKVPEKPARTQAFDRLFATRTSWELRILKLRTSKTTPGVRGIVRVEEEVSSEAMSIPPKYDQVASKSAELQRTKE
jgi:hypothetical protein